MDFTKYLINDVTFENIMDYIASTELYEKSEVLFEEAFDSTIDKYGLHLSEKEKIKFYDDLFSACMLFSNAMMEESFKFAFANALLLACESKAVSQGSLDAFMKVIKK